MVTLKTKFTKNKNKKLVKITNSSNFTKHHQQMHTQKLQFLCTDYSNSEIENMQMILKANRF